MRIVLLISLYLCLVPGLLLANTHSVQFTESEKALLQMTPEELLNVKLSPQSVQQYWEDHGVTSVSKRGEDPFDVASALYVLTQEDIARAGVTTIVEALRLVPGVQVARIDNNKWALSIRGFMRQFASNLLVAVDGVAIHTPTFSGVWWDVHDLVLKDIQRIEVIRGPGSTIWGSNAVSGIVNIVTKHSQHTQGGYLSTLLGNEETGTIEARYGGRLDDDTTYRMSAKRATRDGARSTDDILLRNSSRYTQSAIRIDKNISLEDNLTINANVYDNVSHDMFPYIPSLDTPFKEGIDGRKESVGGSVVSQWERSQQDVSTILKSYVAYDSYKIMPHLKVRGYTFDLDIQQNRYLDEAELSWGAEYRFYHDNYNDTFPYIDYLPDSRNDHFTSFFGQGRYPLIPHRLYAHLGSKFEYSDHTDVEIQPSARLSWYPDERQTIWMAVSRAVRMPTRAERGITVLNNEGTPHGYVGFQGSNDFDVERHIAYELGYRVRPQAGLTLDVSAFYNNYENLRSFSPVQSEDDFFIVYETDNLGKANAYGMEIALDWQVYPALRLEAAYSLFQLDYELSAPHITDIDIGAPKNQFNLRSYYDITSSLQWNVMAYYVDNISKQDIDAYIRWDSNIQWRLEDNITLSVVGQNLFDDQQQEFNSVLYAVPAEIQRSFYTKLSWEF